MKHLNVKQIEEILPHRHPFLLVDYIEDYEPGKYAVGYKCVTFREDFFKGHFPQEPVMPGFSSWKHWRRQAHLPFFPRKKTKGKSRTLAALISVVLNTKSFRGIRSVWRQRSSNRKVLWESEKLLPQWTEKSQ